MANPTGVHGRKRRHHGEGTIIERRDHFRRSRWAVVIPYTDEAGRRRKMWLSASSAEDAEAKRKDALAKLATVPPRSLTTTLGSYLADWLADMAGSVSPSSWDRYRNHVEQRLLPTLGTVTLADLTPTDVKAAARRWRGSPSTREGTTVVLRAALRDAERDGLIATNPARYLRAPSHNAPPPATLDVPDARQLLDAARGDRWYPLLVTMLGLGLRRGEALGLRWSDVSPKEPPFTTIRIEKSLRRVPVRLRTDEHPETARLQAPKYGSYRALPLPAFVADALAERHAEERAERDAAKVWAANDFVFSLANGNPVSFSRLDRWFRKVCKRAKLGHLRLHTLRHSTATILLAEGVDIRTVQAILGHRRIAQTEAYTRVLPRVSADAATRIGAALG